MDDENFDGNKTTKLSFENLIIMGVMKNIFLLIIECIALSSNLITIYQIRTIMNALFEIIKQEIYNIFL